MICTKCINTLCDKMQNFLLLEQVEGIPRCFKAFKCFTYPCHHQHLQLHIQSHSSHILRPAISAMRIFTFHFHAISLTQLLLLLLLLFLIMLTLFMPDGSSVSPMCIQMLWSQLNYQLHFLQVSKCSVVHKMQQQSHKQTNKHCGSSTSNRDWLLYDVTSNQFLMDLH